MNMGGCSHVIQFSFFFTVLMFLIVQVFCFLGYIPASKFPSHPHTHAHARTHTHASGTIFLIEYLARLSLVYWNASDSCAFSYCATLMNMSVSCERSPMASVESILYGILSASEDALASSSSIISFTCVHLLQLRLFLPY